MTELRKRFINELKLRNRSERTIECYVNWIYRLAKYYHRSPDQLSIDEIRKFMRYLAGDCGLSASTLNQALNAIVFFYREILNWEVEGKFDPIKRPKNKQRLPKVYSQHEVYQILCAARAHRHHAELMLMTLYSAGLRVGELCALKWGHIEWDRHSIRIENAKGGKDRIVPLSSILYQPLKAWKAAHQAEENDWVFTTRQGTLLEGGSVLKQYNRAIKRSGVFRRGGVHCLRHSYATHQLERGVDINTLRVLLGHKSIQTTMVYLQVSRKKSRQAGTPLDDLFERFEPQQPQRA